MRRGVEPDPVFIESFVLVKGGQTGYDYRVCANLVHTNMHLALAGHPTMESVATLDTC